MLLTDPIDEDSLKSDRREQSHHEPRKEISGWDCPNSLVRPRRFSSAQYNGKGRAAATVKEHHMTAVWGAQGFSQAQDVAVKTRESASFVTAGTARGLNYSGRRRSKGASQENEWCTIEAKWRRHGDPT